MDEASGTGGGMTIVAWSGELDRLWPTLILSSTGAAAGLEVTVFFTFWGLFPLVRDDVRVTGDDALSRLLSVANPPGMKRARLSRLDVRGSGARLLRRAAARHRVPQPEELLTACQDLGVGLWPCQMTMDLLGIDRDQLIDGVGEPVGATTVLDRMQQSRINLFI